jgi:hypothetical protein
MATKKTEPVEAEVVSEETTMPCCENKRETSRGGAFWGLVLIALGGIFIAESFTDINLWQYFWPGVLVVFGLSLVIRSMGR